MRPKKTIMNKIGCKQQETQVISDDDNDNDKQKCFQCNKTKLKNEREVSCTALFSS